MTTTIALASRAAPSLYPGTIALEPRTAPSLYSGMILALIALAFALQASFLAGLALGQGGLGASPEPTSSTMTASLPLPCASNP